MTANFGNIGELPNQYDSITLAACGGFGDKNTSFFDFFLKTILIFREEVGFGVKVEVVRPILPELVENES